MIRLRVQCSQTGKTHKFDVDDYMWSEIMLPYVQMQEKNADLSKCFKILNENLHKRSSNLLFEDKIINKLTIVSSLFNYLNEATHDNVLTLLQRASSDEIAPHFIQLLKSNELRRVDIIGFLNNFYDADFKSGELASEVWTKMRPISDEGKTRGYSGPSELPLLLLAGGYKADRGDLIINNEKIELKGDGGRVGEGVNWDMKSTDVEHLIKSLKLHSKSTAPQQSLFNFSEKVQDTCTACNLKRVPNLLLDTVREYVKQNNDANRQDIINIIGVYQLTMMMLKKNDDWFVLFKHPGKPTAPIGTAFIINAREAIFSAAYILRLHRALHDAHVKFTPCYDSGGYKMKFYK